MKTNRRDFVRMGTVAGLGIAGMTLTNSEAFGQKKDKNKAPLKHDPNIVRVGYIGLGGRGSGHVHDSITVGGIEVVAVCDIKQEAVENAQKIVTKNGMKPPKAYTGSDHAYEEMLKNEQLDAVIIATPWEWHVPMAVASMKAGVPYTGVEVSAANTIEECWDLVNVHEQTGNQVMMRLNNHPTLFPLIVWNGNTFSAYCKTSTDNPTLSASTNVSASKPVSALLFSFVMFNPFIRYTSGNTSGKNITLDTAKAQ